MQLFIPPTLTKKHRRALTTYLTDDRLLSSTEWSVVYEAINILEQGRFAFQHGTRSFRQVYNLYIDRKFADLYISKLLTLDDVPNESLALAATYARKISSALKRIGLLNQDARQNGLFLAYCIYWWQSFARGYAFEVEIWRDLEDSGVIFEAHDLRYRPSRYSPADLVVLGLKGDLKRSAYFLKFKPARDLPNDFYITRWYEKGRQRTLVVFQKPPAWDKINGEVLYEGQLDDILQLLPQPVRVQHNNVTLVVVDYPLWKRKVLQKQHNEGE